MTYFPIQLNIRGRHCVIIGAGSVAARKAASLLACGATVTVIAPDAAEAVREMARAGQVQWIAERYKQEHLQGAWLVFAATENSAVNANVTRDAREQGLLVCDVSAPGDGDFVSPSVVRRGELTLTASTGGGSPTLAIVIKERLEQAFGPEWDGLTEIISRLRDEIKVAGGEAARRDAVRCVVTDDQVGQLISQGKLLEAEARARECLCSLSE